VAAAAAALRRLLKMRTTTLEALDAFLHEQGFAEYRRYRFAHRPGLRAYCDVVYLRNIAPPAQAAA
jgi:hypothetical protein